jgi:hypothetical protein
MPRPKPPEPLLITTVRITQTQRIELRRLGGSAWLRAQIEKAKKQLKS